MHTPNTMFYLDKALFDELYFPKCTSGNRQGETYGTTCLDRPASNQPPYNNASDDITPDDLDDTPPELPQGRCTLQPDRIKTGPLDDSEEPPEQQALPCMPDPIPAPPEPRRSTQLRRTTTHPDNANGQMHPTEIAHDIEWTCTW